MFPMSVYGNFKIRTMVRDLFINAIRGQKIKDLVPIKQHMYTLFFTTLDFK